MRTNILCSACAVLLLFTSCGGASRSVAPYPASATSWLEGKSAPITSPAPIQSDEILTVRAQSMPTEQAPVSAASEPVATPLIPLWLAASLTLLALLLLVGAYLAIRSRKNRMPEDHAQTERDSLPQKKAS